MAVINEQNYGRNNIAQRMRKCEGPMLMAWPTANGATALPEVLSEATYTELGNLAPGNAPKLLATGTGIYGYRPGMEDKMLQLEFCSVTGAADETQVWEIGLYAAPYILTRPQGSTAGTQTGWKNIGTAIITLTLGTRTLATQVTDPYVNSQTFVSSTIRWADTYAETHNDFANSTAGFYQIFSMGYGAANKSGHVCIDPSFCSLVAMRLTTKAATSIQELVGLYAEIN